MCVAAVVGPSRCVSFVWFPYSSVCVPPGSRAKVGEAPVCVRVPRPPARPRRRRCARVTPPPQPWGSRLTRARDGHAGISLPAPLCPCQFFPARAWTLRLRLDCLLRLGVTALSWTAPSPALMSAPLGGARPPRLGVTAPLLGCSPPNPPARGRAACSRDPPPCSGSRGCVLAWPTPGSSRVH